MVREVKADHQVVIDLKGARFLARVAIPVQEGDALSLRVESASPDLRLRVVTADSTPADATSTDATATPPPPSDGAQVAAENSAPAQAQPTDTQPATAQLQSAATQVQTAAGAAAETLLAYGASTDAANMQLVQSAAQQAPSAPEAARAVVASLVAAGFPPTKDMVASIASLVDPAPTASVDEAAAALPPATLAVEDMQRIEALTVKVNETLADPGTRQALQVAKGPTPVALLDRIEEAVQARVESDPTLQSIDAAFGAVEQAASQPTVASDAQRTAEQIAAKVTPDNVDQVAQEVGALPPQNQQAVREALLSVRVSQSIALEARQEALDIVRRMQATPQPTPAQAPVAAQPTATAPTDGQEAAQPEQAAAATTPTVQTAQPPVQAAQPPVQASQPPVQTSQPPVQTSQPPLQTPQPPVQTSQPPVQTPQPPTPPPSAADPFLAPLAPLAVPPESPDLAAKPPSPTNVTTTAAPQLQSSEGQAPQAQAPSQQQALPATPTPAPQPQIPQPQTQAPQVPVPSAPPTVARYVAIPLPAELGGDTVLARVVTDLPTLPPVPPKTPPAAGQTFLADVVPSPDGDGAQINVFDQPVRVDLPAGTRVALRIEAVVPDLGLPAAEVADASTRALLEVGLPPTPERVAAVDRAVALVPPLFADGVRAVATMLLAKGLSVEPRGIRELALRNPEGVLRLAALSRLVSLSEQAGVRVPAPSSSDASALASLGGRVAQSLASARAAGAAIPAIDLLLARLPEAPAARVPVAELASALSREFASLEEEAPSAEPSLLPSRAVGTPIAPHVISDLLSPMPQEAAGSTDDALLRNLVGLLRPVVDRGADGLRETIGRAVEGALAQIPREGLEALAQSLQELPSGDPVRAILLEHVRRALTGSERATVDRVLAEVTRSEGLGADEIAGRVRQALEGADRRTVAAVRSALVDKERTAMRDAAGLPQLQSLYTEARALFDRLGALKLMDVATLPRDEKALHFQLPLVVDGQVRSAQLRVTYRERREGGDGRARYEMTGMVLRVEMSRLGAVSSKLDVRGDGLSVLFRVDTARAKSVLESGRSELESALGALGREAVVSVAIRGAGELDPLVPPPVREAVDVDVTA